MKGIKHLPINSHSLTRGVWQLARLHTREAWLCWYPAVWGACLSVGSSDVSLDLSRFGQVLFGIWSSVTATHCAFCTFNDICDRNLDANVERCKNRPLPSGMISLAEAIVAFLAWIPITVAITYLTLDEVILGVIIGSAVFPGWAAVTNDLRNLDQALPLFGATMSWVVYFDVFYATQDRSDDEKIGVKSLAVVLGSQTWIFLAFLGILQVAFFAVTALRAHMSSIFWVFGLGVWAMNIPCHVYSLDMHDRKSGGRIFKANIMLGLYMTAISVVDLFFNRVHP